jgi:hypothetical protein
VRRAQSAGQAVCSQGRAGYADVLGTLRHEVVYGGRIHHAAGIDVPGRPSANQKSRLDDMLARWSDGPLPLSAGLFSLAHSRLQLFANAVIAASRVAA